MRITNEQKEEIKVQLQQFIAKVDDLEESDAEAFEATLQYFKNYEANRIPEAAALVNSFIRQTHRPGAKLHVCLSCGDIGRDLIEKVLYFGQEIKAHPCVRISARRGPAITIETSWESLRDNLLGGPKY